MHPIEPPPADGQLTGFLDRVFAPEGSAVSVAEVASASEQGATGYQESLLIIGASTAPKFLASPGPLVRALTAHSKLRAPKDRVTRMAAASALALGVGRPRKRASVARPVHLEVFPGHDPHESLVHKKMARVAGLATDRIMVVLRPIDDHYKPTITLLENDGVPAGFAKLGWTLKTAAMVRRETAALKQVGTDLGSSIEVPALLGSGDHFGRPFLVSAPMPAKASRAPRDLPANSLIEQLGGPIRRAATAAMFVEVESAISTAAARGDTARAQLLQKAIVELSGMWGSEVAVTRSHGDWVPWNVATYRGRFVVWDWEHFHDSLPVGVDAFHWVMLSSHLLDGKSWRESFSLAEQTLQARLPELVNGVTNAPTSAQLSLFHAALLTSRSETLRTIEGNEPFPLDNVVADLVQRTSSRKGSD